MIVELKFKVTGVVPLLMHNGQTADPLNEWSRRIKKLSGKRDKTDADYEEMMRLEWYAGLYLTEDKEPCLPGEVVEGAFFEAAKKTKQGKLSKSGIYSEGNFPLIYDGEKDIDKLFLDPEFRFTCSVKIRGSRVMRTRPKFNEWSAVISIFTDNEVLNDEEVVKIMKTAGQSCGYCDWRPRFGRFTTELVTGKKK